jgi:delta 1-pyrroline-5-carboxylate dehydrogenase
MQIFLLSYSVPYNRVLKQPQVYGKMKKVTVTALSLSLPTVRKYRKEIAKNEKERDMNIQSLNPAIEEVLATFELCSPTQIDRAQAATHTAFHSWRETSFAERSTLFHKVANYLREHKLELANNSQFGLGGNL